VINHEVIAHNMSVMSVQMFPSDA